MYKKYDAYIVGYYGMDNSGDDALLLSTLWGSKQFLDCERVQISTTSDLPKRFDNQCAVLKSEQRFKGQNRAIHYMNAMQSKRVIFGGGSVLHTASDINMKRHMMRLAIPSKSMALGIGIEPFKTKADEQSCANFLNECGYTSVRDEESLKIARQIAPKANVIKAFDLAPCLLNHPDFYQGTFTRQGIAFNLCPVPVNEMGDTKSNQEHKRVTDIAQVIEHVFQATGEPITLINFNGHINLGDWKLSRDLQKLLQDRVPIIVEPYNPDPLAVLNKIQKFKALVGMRLHANVFAYLAGTPAISLHYHEKCKGWAKQIGLSPDYQFNALNIDKNRLINNILNAVSTGETGVTLPIESAVEQSLYNWRHQHETAKNFCRYTAVQ